MAESSVHRSLCKYLCIAYAVYIDSPKHNWDENVYQHLFVYWINQSVRLCRYEETHPSRISAVSMDWNITFEQLGGFEHLFGRESNFMLKWLNLASSGRTQTHWCIDIIHLYWTEAVVIVIACNVKVGYCISGNGVPGLEEFHVSGERTTQAELFGTQDGPKIGRIEKNWINAAFSKLNFNCFTAKIVVHRLRSHPKRVR